MKQTKSYACSSTLGGRQSYAWYSTLGHMEFLLQDLDDALLCNIPSPWRHDAQYLFQFSTFAFFFVPMVLISIMYILIGLALSATQRNTDGKKNKAAVVAATKARKAVLKMLGEFLLNSFHY